MDVQRLLSAKNVKNCKKGEVIRDSEPTMYIVLSGQVESVDMRPSVKVYQPGDFFGENFLFCEYADLATIVAKEESELFIISRANFSTVSKLYPYALFEILREICERHLVREEIKEEELVEQPAPINLNIRGRMRQRMAALTGGHQHHENPLLSAAVENPKLAEPKPKEVPAVAAEAPKAPLVEPSVDKLKEPIEEKQPEKSEPEEKANNVAVEVISGPSQNKIEIITNSEIFPEGHGKYTCDLVNDYEKYVFFKEEKCPVCRKAFKVSKLYTSKIMEDKGMRADTRRFFTGFQHLWFEVSICPHCFFSCPSDYMGNAQLYVPKLIPPEFAQMIEKEKPVLTDTYDINRAFLGHYLAVQCSKGLRNFRQVNSRVWMNIYWLYEDVMDKEMQRFAAEKAYEANFDFYSQNTLKPVSTQSINLMMSGLLAFMGRYTEARKLAFNARGIKDGKPVYSDLADSVLEELRESAKHETT